MLKHKVTVTVTCTCGVTLSVHPRLAARALAILAEHHKLIGAKHGG